MHPATMDQLLAELSADELAAVSEYLHLFVSSGTMPPGEADEWRYRIVAWQWFLSLSSAPSKPVVYRNSNGGYLAGCQYFEGLPPCVHGCHSR